MPDKKTKNTKLAQSKLTEMSKTKKMGLPKSKKVQAEQIVSRLAELYPDADCTLFFREPWKLLIAAILAAQCTDARVNIVAGKLFSEFPTPESLADLDIEILEDRIRSCGFYHMKAKSIKNSMQMLVHQYHGRVPDQLADLVAMPGVGRKIANLVLGDCFGNQAIVVDTHCARISRHLGLTDSEDPRKIEQDLMKWIPRNEWTSYGHRIVAHGRAVCTARNPKCSRCLLQTICRKGIQTLG